VGTSIRTTAPSRTVAAVLAETWLLAKHLPLPVDRPDQLLTGTELPGVLRCERADENGIVLRGPEFGEVTVSVADGIVEGGGQFVAAWLREVVARAEGLADAPKVVGAAIIADGAVLAAQRSYPPELAGRWEFPGGRVEAGETEQAAIVREIQEELGATVRVDGRIGPDLILPNGWLLRIHAARLVDGQRPDALEHHALRWVGAAGLASLDWLDADRAVLPALRNLL
jgi:8-oxo-dGTP diphosphatase